MADANSRQTGQRYPHILNSVNYKDAGELYATASGNLKEGESGGFRKRNGLAVTVTIPPSLRAFRYPALTNQNLNNIYLSTADRNEFQNRAEWFKAARANSADTDKAIITTQRRISALEKKKVRAERAGRTALVAELNTKITSEKEKLARLEAGSTEKISGLFSTEFEITDFITSLSWSSVRENSYVELNIGLDNIQGLFNYLPEGAKVTVWRRKSLQNINALHGGKWYRYITTYILSKSRSASGREHTMEINCADRWYFAGIQHYTGKKKWVDDKQHPKGWTPREITIQVCEAVGLPIEKEFIPKSYIIKKKVTKSTERGKRPTVQYERVTLPRIKYDKLESDDLQAIIRGAWDRSIQKIPLAKQLPFSMHMRSGSLRVEFVSTPGDPLTQVTEPQLGDPEKTRLVPMFTDKENIESISIEESVEPDDFYTVLLASGVYNEKKKVKGKTRIVKKKVKAKEFIPSGGRGELIIQAYGRRVRKENLSKRRKRAFSSRAAFERAAQARIDEISRPVRTLSLEGLGPLGIWPYYYVYVESIYAGIRANLWVTSVNYTIEEGRIKVALELHTNRKHYSSGEKFFTSSPAGKLTLEDRWY